MTRFQLLQLTTDIQSSPSLPVFRQRLKHFFIDNHFLILYCDSILRHCGLRNSSAILATLKKFGLTLTLTLTSASKWSSLLQHFTPASSLPVFSSEHTYQEWNSCLCGLQSLTSEQSLLGRGAGLHPCRPISAYNAPETSWTATTALTGRRGIEDVRGKEEEKGEVKETNLKGCNLAVFRMDRRHYCYCCEKTQAYTGWRFSAVVALFVARTKLLNVEPG